MADSFRARFGFVQGQEIAALEGGSPGGRQRALAPYEALLPGCGSISGRGRRRCSARPG